VFTTFSLAKAEEMADLIDGYCMLFSGKKHSLVFKKLGMAKVLDMSALVIQGGKILKSTCPAGQEISVLTCLQPPDFKFWCTKHLAIQPCCLLGPADPSTETLLVNIAANMVT